MVFDLHNSVKMLVESVVSCPESEDYGLFWSAKLVVAILSKSDVFGEVVVTIILCTFHRIDK